MIWLVGAGPGDPDLLTVRATRVLHEADVVLHDRLVDERVLALTSARRVNVGQTPQAEINELLVLYGLAGHQVVRLKGGDPFVFGRGREEADALEAAGLAWEVVPGITSALAAPALAGIPVTHRSLATSFTVVTATLADGGEADWATLARLDGTIVVLMGAARRAEIAARLIDAGLAPATPVAAVMDAATPGQTEVAGRLDELGSLPVHAPAVIVIGGVASYVRSTIAR